MKMINKLTVLFAVLVLVTLNSCDSVKETVVEKFTISTELNGDGSISPVAAVVDEGKSEEFIIEADEGYKV